jgi:hypothetical protein
MSHAAEPPGRGVPVISKHKAYGSVPPFCRQKLDKFVPLPIVGEPFNSAPVVEFKYVPFGSIVSSKMSFGVPPTALSKDEKPEGL